MVTKHDMLLDALRERIRSGELQPDNKLPSINQLCAQYDVAASTVRGVMLVLKAEGWVEGRPGQGVYVRHRGE